MIKKQDAIAALRKNHYSGLAASVVDSCIQTIQALPEETPVADVEPVRHGEWLEDDDDIICPECQMHWNKCDNCTETFVHCPNCGRKLGW